MAKTTLTSIDIVPCKCGIVLSPPAVLYIYKHKQTKKLRKLSMPVHNISDNSDIEFFAEDLKMRHKPLLDDVKIDTIKKMIFLLVKHKEGMAISDALTKYDEIEQEKNELKLKIANICKISDNEFDDDLGGDTDFDDLDAPIDKLGIYSDDDGDQFWQLTNQLEGKEKLSNKLFGK